MSKNENESTIRTRTAEYLTYIASVDYDKTAMTTKRFYASVQNKMHFAVHGHMVAELILERANSTQEYVGLTV